MNWLILVSDVVFALIAAILGMLGLSTLRATRRWGVGKSFWIPVSVSGALFLVGSILTIAHEIAVELNWSLTINTNEIVHVSSLLALCILMYGIRNYSRKVKTATILPIQDADNAKTRQTNEQLQRA